MKLLVLGASGGCGQWMVRIAHERGHRVSAVVRAASRYNPPAGVSVIRGDVLEAGVLDAAMHGQDAVLSGLGNRLSVRWNPWSALVSPKDFTSRATRGVIDAMRRHGVRRIAVISAGGVGDSASMEPRLLRLIIVNSNVRHEYADLDQMEQMLRASELDWLAARPVVLADGPVTGRARPIDRYRLMSRITRADVGAWLVQAIERAPPFHDRTPLIGSD